MDQGDVLAPKDIENHTLIIAPLEFIPHIQTEFTKPGEQSPAIKCHVVDFVDPNAPVIYRGVLFFNVSLYNNLKKQLGEFVAGRLYKGQAKPGQSAPWLLQDVTVEPEWMRFLGSWLDNTPAGTEFQQEAAAAMAEASSLSAPAANPPAGPPAPPAPAPIPAGPAPVAATPGVPAAPSFPTAPTVVPTSAPARVAAPADFAAMLAGLPAEEQARMLALMAQQGNAAS
jgi:hypothetical protein